jgi:hypothetical protein
MPEPDAGTRVTTYGRAMSARILMSIAALLMGLLGASAVATAAFPASPASPASAASHLPSERQWHRDVRHAMAGSHAYLKKAVAVDGPRYAINLDIDNTSLATHYDPGAPVLPVRSFVRYAESLGVAVLFNTARYGVHVQQGERLLHRAHFPLTEICGRSSTQEAIGHSKPRCRRHFVSEQYTIVANVGNNPTDFSGVKDYGRAFRLPNYGGRLG